MTFERIAADQYRLTHTEQRIVLEVSRLRRERQDVVGELAAFCGLLGARSVDGGAVHIANFNLSSATARRDRARILAERSRAAKVDWAALLEELCQRVFAAEREGEPAILLAALPPPTRDEEYTLDGFTVPSKHASIIFAEGGSAKSYLMLYFGGVLARAGLNVAFIDWELDQWTHRLRLEQLFGPKMPDVRYVRCDRPLVHEADRLGQIIHRESIDYALFDSIGFACDGPPEAAESALSYFRAARQLGIGGLHSAHITKNGENAEQRPFGSAFFHNSARCTWFAKLAATSPDGKVITVGLFNRKANLGPLRAPLAFDVAFDENRTTFTRVDVSAVDELAASLPLWQRIRGELRSGHPRTIAELATCLGAKVDTVEKTLKRRGDMFTRLSGEDGIHRFALVERRAS
jgi:hypothetical protein